MPTFESLVVDAHDDIGSTQEHMRERIRRGERVHGHVVRARRQLVGSGTRGRSWSSERGGSYQTLAVQQSATANDGESTRRLTAPGVSVAVGIGLAAALAAHGARAMVKWPNDLYYRECKLGGILCESFRAYLLVGVGVNVANPPPAGGAALTGWDLATVHDLVLSGVLAGLEIWRSGAALTEPFAAHDWLAGREVEVMTGGRTLSGVARGVSADGALLMGDALVQDGTVLAIGARAP